MPTARRGRRASAGQSEPRPRQRRPLGLGALRRRSPGHRQALRGRDRLPVRRSGDGLTVRRSGDGLTVRRSKCARRACAVAGGPQVGDVRQVRTLQLTRAWMQVPGGGRLNRPCVQHRREELADIIRQRRAWGTLRVLGSRRIRAKFSVLGSGGAWSIIGKCQMLGTFGTLLALVTFGILSVFGVNRSFWSIRRNGARPGLAEAITTEPGAGQTSPLRQRRKMSRRRRRHHGAADPPRLTPNPLVVPHSANSAPKM